MAGTLGINWPKANVVGILRILLEEIAPDKVDTFAIDDYLYLSVCEVAEAIGVAGIPDYLTIVEDLTQSSNVIDVSEQNIDVIDTLEDVDAGYCYEATNKQIKNILTIPQKSEYIHWTLIGTDIHLVKGADATLGATFILTYNRIPAKSVDDDTSPTPVVFLDIRDKYIPLVIATTKLSIYEQLKLSPPNDLKAQIMAQVEKFKLSQMQEKYALGAKQ